MPTTSKRTIEVDDTTAMALERRAAEVGLSVPELLAEMVGGARSAKLSSAEIEGLDRQWARIKNGEPTVAHEDVVRWLDTWGTAGFERWKGQ